MKSQALELGHNERSTGRVQSIQPSPVAQAQAGASSSGDSPLIDHFRGDCVSWHWTALKSSEHFFSVSRSLCPSRR